MSTPRNNLKRVYEAPSREDGMRVLVERLWPRGLSKTDAAIDFWGKDVAPTAKLRTWFGHRAELWEEFLGKAAVGRIRNLADSLDSSITTRKTEVHRCMREIAETLSVDREGFELLRHMTAVEDLYK